MATAPTNIATPITQTDGTDSTNNLASLVYIERNALGNTINSTTQKETTIRETNAIFFTSDTWLGGGITDEQKADIYFKLNGATDIALSDVDYITLNAGDKLYFLNKGASIVKNNNSIIEPLFDTSLTFNMSGDFCKFLWGTRNTTANYACAYMFAATKVVDASGLFIAISHFVNFNQSLALGSYMCESMFRQCTSLKHAPRLPETMLGNYCYQRMFRDCTSLTTAPELPATTLATGCYSTMFYSCTSLTTAPELPATTLATNCYQRMFYSCSKLNNVTCLATNIQASSCTIGWLSNAHSTGIFTKAAGFNGWSRGTNGIPAGWTIKDYEE